LTLKSTLRTSFEVARSATRGFEPYAHPHQRGNVSAPVKVAAGVAATRAASRSARLVFFFIFRTPPAASQAAASTTRRPPSLDATSSSGRPCGESLMSAGADAGAFQAHDHRSSGSGDASIGAEYAGRLDANFCLVRLRPGTGTLETPPPSTLSETPYGSRAAHSAGCASS
jgi:hypothetical protein